jgi:hypothetical protein
VSGCYFSRFWFLKILSINFCHLSWICLENEVGALVVSFFYEGFGCIFGSLLHASFLGYKFVRNVLSWVQLSVLLLG